MYHYHYLTKYRFQNSNPMTTERVDNEIYQGCQQILDSSPNLHVANLGMQDKAAVAYIAQSWFQLGHTN